MDKLMTYGNFPGAQLAIAKMVISNISKLLVSPIDKMASYSQPATLRYDISKLITGVAILKRMQEGRLSLDDTSFLFLDKLSPPIGAIPGLLMVIGLFFIPETPRWLAKSGLKDQLYSSLQKLRGEDHDIIEEVMDIQEAVEIFKLQPKAKLSDLFKGQIFYPLLAGIGLLLFQQLSGINAVMLYAGQIFREVGISSSNAASFGLGFLQVLMTIVTAGLVERAGRRILLMVSAGGMAFSSSLVGLSFYLKDIAGDDISRDMSTYVGLLAVFGLLVYIISYSLGIGPVPWIVLGEILPARVRGTAGSLATLISWFSAWVVTLTFNFLLEWSAPGSFWIFAAICIGNVIFVAFFVPETRGQTLEQIEASFK